MEDLPKRSGRAVWQGIPPNNPKPTSPPSLLLLNNCHGEVLPIYLRGGFLVRVVWLVMVALDDL